MSGVSGIGLNRLSSSGEFARFTPQPKNTAGIGFQDVLKAATSIAGTVAPVAGLDSGYQALIAKQIEVQQQMQMMTMHSNIEKSKHETQMSAIRNMRAA